MSNLRITPITKKKREQEELRITPILTEEEKKQQIMSQSKVMTHEPAPQVKMTIDSINNKINTNINQKIISGGIENEIHNMNMKNIGKTSLDKNIDLSGKSVMGKTTPVDTSDFIYNDTGKKYGDYYYDNYELYKDMPIYEQHGKYYLKTNKGYEELGRLDKNGNVAHNVMTNEETEKEELEKAKKLGYKDNITKITTQDYDDAQDIFKQLKNEYKLSDKELNDWIKTGDLPIHVSIQTNSMSSLKNKAEEYRTKINSGKIKQYNQQGFGAINQLDIDLQNMSDEEKQHYISSVTGKKDPTLKNENTFFKGSSVFDDGYQFGDISKATLGTIGNAGYSLLKGTGKFIEGTSDFAENLIGSGLESFASDKDKKDVKEFRNNTWNIGYKYGNKNYWYDKKNNRLYDENWNRVYNFDLSKLEKRYTYSNGVAEFGRQMKEQTVSDETSQVFDEILHGNDLRKASVLGNKSEAMLESMGQALPLMGAGATVGGLYGEGAAVATTSGLTFASTYGNAKTEAIRNGATEKEAIQTAFVQATAETISEQFFDAIPGAKSAGWGEKLVGKVGNSVEKYMGSRTAKIVTKALDISGEGFEEIISNMLTAGGNDIVHFIDKDFNYGMENQSGNILDDMTKAMTSQDSMDSFISAIITSALLNAGSSKINSSNENQIINEIVRTYAKEYNMSIDEAKNRLKINGDNIEFDTNNINQKQNTPNLPNNSTVEQRNINNNINNQVNENVENSMDTIQNNKIPENINNQQNNQLENLIEPQNINYSKNVNDRIDLEDYDFKTEQVIKSAERNVIVRNYRQLDTLIDEALDTQSNKALHFGRINETITQRIKRKLENLPKMKAPYLTKEKYDLVMNQSEIRHLIDEKAMMTREDVHKYVRVLPEIISNFDSASYSIEPDSEGIRFKKKLPDGNYISFVLVSNKQSTLKAKSIHLDKIDYETKKRSISPTNDVLKTPDRTSETDGAFASMKELAQARVQFPTSPNSLNEQVAPTGLLNNSASRFVEQPVSNNDNTTISPKSQIAPLPQYNMQQKTKNDTTKIKPPIAKEYQKNTIEEKIEKSDVPDVLKISGDNLIEQSSNLTNDDIAQILTEEPKTENTKNKRKLAILGAQLLDKGLVFENLSLKTKNRDLMGKWDYTLTSEARGQNVIGNGHYEFDSETKTKKQTSKSLYDIQKEVNNSGNTKEFYEYLYHKHNIDRMSLKDKYGIDNKPVFGDNIDAEYSKNIVNEYEENYPQFTDYAQDIYDYLNADRQELIKSGVITQELADYWQEMYPHYVPIRREDTFGNAIDVPLDTKKTSINAPIKKAKGGNQNILPLFDTIAKRTLQTYRAVAKNNFGIELKNTLNSSIDITDTNVDDIINNIDFQDELLTKGKNGSNPTFTVFENGKKVTFEITKDMYDALKPVSESSILSKTFKPFNKVMSIYRGILTEYNPVFMLTNSIKDAQDVLINSQHSTKTYKNIPEAYKQILSKGYWYQEYVSNGGEQNSYFDNWKNKFVKDEQNFLGRIVKWPFKKVSQANNVIEMAPRLAEYIASRQEGRSIETSMLDAARVTTNFKAGGDTTKFLNRNGGIFLNASVQGLVQNVRNVREARANGLKGWTNLATKCIIAGIPALILNNMVWDDDDDYNELADYVKDNYYIIAKYGDGKFIRIPKGRTIAVIQNAFTQVADSTTGNDKADLDRFLNLATSNLAPNNPIENNIFSPIIQVLSNKTWYGEDLVPQRLQSSPNKQQYDETTDSFSKWLGNKLNISPYKIHYLLDQYSGGVGDVVLPMMTPKAENGSDSIGGKVISPLIDKFTTDSVMNNKYVGDFYDVKDKATQKAHSIDATEKDILMSKYLNSKNFYLNQLYAEKRAIQNSKLKDSEKYKKVREKQDEINKLAKQSIDEYKKVKINGSSATVGDITYRKDKNGEWTKVKDK